jgi:hypothetical protein
MATFRFRNDFFATISHALPTNLLGSLRNPFKSRGKADEKGEALSSAMGRRP